MVKNNQNLLLFSGSSHPELSKQVSGYLGIPLGQVVLDRFPDGEISLQIQENVRGRDVFIIQTIAIDPNNYLMELLIMIDSLRRASAQSIGVVIPYFGYSRQDRKDRPRVPITAKLVANLLVQAGASRIITMDLHAEQLQGFFDIPLDNLYARPVLAEAFRKDYGAMISGFNSAINGVRSANNGEKNLVVVTPDLGSVKLARAYASHLKVDFAIVDKQRHDANHVEVIALIGDVKGKDVLLADDMCSTASTLVSAANVCQEKGAKRIFAAVTHGIFIKDAVKKIEQSPIEVLYTSNTIPFGDRLDHSNKIKTVSVANLFGQAISCILSRESISSLFKIEAFEEPNISHS